jgi:hypothetical protein
MLGLKKTELRRVHKNDRCTASPEISDTDNDSTIHKSNRTLQLSVSDLVFRCSPTDALIKPKLIVASNTIFSRLTTNASALTSQLARVLHL